MGQCKLDCSIVSHPVHYCITIQILEIHVWTVSVWLLMHRITCLKDEILDVVSAKYIQYPIINMADMVIIEYHLGIQGRIVTHEGIMGHGFMLTTTMHIY